MVTSATGAARVVADVMITTPKACDPAATAGEVRALFLDEHLHAVLVVDRGTLIAVIEPSDLPWPGADEDVAAPLGTLRERVVQASTPLPVAERLMRTAGRRRLAVIDADCRLQGLLCLKRTGTGFCSDQDVQSRGRVELLPPRSDRTLAGGNNSSRGERMTRQA